MPCGFCKKLCKNLFGLNRHLASCKVKLALPLSESSTLLQNSHSQESQETVVEQQQQHHHLPVTAGQGRAGPIPPTLLHSHDILETVEHHQLPEEGHDSAGPQCHQATASDKTCQEPIRRLGVDNIHSVAGGEPHAGAQGVEAETQAVAAEPHPGSRPQVEPRLDLATGGASYSHSVAGIQPHGLNNLGVEAELQLGPGVTGHKSSSELFNSENVSLIIAL